MTTIIAPFQDAAGWERTPYAFLAEKERRSGSRHTVEGYSRMLQHFFGSLGNPPDRVTSQEVFAWAYGKGLSGKEPSPVTIGARLACLSSFYRCLTGIAYGAGRNPANGMQWRLYLSGAKPTSKGATARRVGRARGRCQNLPLVFPLKAGFMPPAERHRSALSRLREALSTSRPFDGVAPCRMPRNF